MGKKMGSRTGILEKKRNTALAKRKSFLNSQQGKSSSVSILSELTITDVARVRST